MFQAAPPCLGSCSFWMVAETSQCNSSARRRARTPPSAKDNTLSGWIMPRFFTRGVCLAAAAAIAVLTLLLASANAAPSEEQAAAGASVEFNKEAGTLYIDWSGPIVAGM